jgi:4-hydroxy-tetrahydrodipicolinate synthase
MNGVLPAVLTPFSADGSPDGVRLAQFCTTLLAEGASGLAVFGTTGEGTSLTVDERLGLLDALTSAGLDARLLLPGTGCAALPDTVRLTRAAVRAGCAGTLVLPPFYYKDVGDDGLFRYYSELIERVGDERLRLYLYNFPKLSGLKLSVALIERLRARFGAVIAGLKDSSADWSSLKAYLEAFASQMSIFSGTEKLLLASLRMGGAGCITAVGNVAVREIDALYRGHREPAAEELQKKADVARAALEGKPLIASLKAIVAERLSDEQWRAVRPPL